jgi:hypothetical protein
MPNENDSPNTPNAEEIRAAVLAELSTERAALTAAAEELLTAELAAIPEHLRSLVPDVSTAEKLAWIRKAKAAQPQNVPATDQRRPSNTPAPRDMASLPPIARIAAGYNKN